jgi:hypothetical protein
MGCTPEVRKLGASVCEQCKYCQEHAAAVPRPIISLPATCEWGECLTVDEAYYRGRCFLFAMDYAFHFLLILPISITADATEIFDLLRATWFVFAGTPKATEFDAHPRNRSAAMEDMCRGEGIKPVVSTPHCHWRNPLVENAIGTSKETLATLIEANPSLSDSAAASATARAHNILASYVDAQSPWFRVFGKNPSMVHTHDAVWYDQVEKGKAKSPVTDREQRFARILAQKVFLEKTLNRRCQNALRGQVRERAQAQPSDIGRKVMYSRGDKVNNRTWHGGEIVGIHSISGEGAGGSWEYAVRAENSRIHTLPAERVSFADM